ncbi:MAG: beta-lactamase family protein [Planctomycetes bacterium]|nr:beta-lactamase family protein [Planctomycetota bacterium]
MLAEGGKLNLTSRLAEFYPKVPNAQDIQIVHLLGHRSGVAELDDPEIVRKGFSIDNLVDRLEKTVPEFKPGTRDRYSREGYLLLAAIIQRAGGVSYRDYLDKTIFAPLEMKDSGDAPAEWSFANAATGYVAGAGGKGIVPLPFVEAVTPGGGSLYSTAPDLLRWLETIRTNRLFKFEAQPYPYGWGRRKYSGHWLVEQSGLVEASTPTSPFIPRKSSK